MMRMGVLKNAKLDFDKKYKKGEEPIMKIFEQAIRLEPPRVAVEKYPHNDRLILLVSTLVVSSVGSHLKL